MTSGGRHLVHPRTAAHVLDQIAGLLELNGENRFRTSAYRNASRAVAALNAEDLGPLVQSGALAATHGIGPATLAVVEDLLASGESAQLARLLRDTPPGVLELLDVPGLGAAKLHAIRTGLGISSLDELEAAARDGRLAQLPRFGPKTAARILEGVAFRREARGFMLYPRAAAAARQLVASIERYPEVIETRVAGSIRRHREVVRDIDLVAMCRSDPAALAAEVTRGPGVESANGVGTSSVDVRYTDGTALHLHATDRAGFAVALWRATGSATHEEALRARAAARGMSIDGDSLRDREGHRVAVADEAALFAAVGLPYIEPELREGDGEIAAAIAHRLPHLITARDLRGVLHCHSRYSDGRDSIGEMAAAAQERGWSYLGISDHSQSASYAGGLSPDAVLAQHEEIDRVNREMEHCRVLKGIEADILADGRIDYTPELLGRFDYVIASVHSQFSMDERSMTERVLAALDDPHVSILAHPTGRLLLGRAGYGIDLEAVLGKAAAVGVAVELNADPHRLDLDWRHCRRAKALGCRIEIGPDAHSTNGLDNTEFGVGIARKGWIEPGDVLNAASADEVLAHARARRERR